VQRRSARLALPREERQPAVGRASGLSARSSSSAAHILFAGAHDGGGGCGSRKMGTTVHDAVRRGRHAWGKRRVAHDHQVDAGGSDGRQLRGGTIVRGEGIAVALTDGAR
jgi:hypothetical protein